MFAHHKGALVDERGRPTRRAPEAPRQQPAQEPEHGLGEELPADAAGMASPRAKGADRPRDLSRAPHGIEGRAASRGVASTWGGRNVSAIATAPTPIAAEPMNIHA